MVAVDNQFMREVNAAAVLSALRSTAHASVSELAKWTGLSRQAVTRSLSHLADSGLVEFLPPDRSAERMGRPAQLVRFRSEAGYVVGAGLSPAEVHVGVADLVGNVVGEARHQVANDGTPFSVDDLAACIDEALQAAGVAVTDVWALSVGMPGVVDPATGTVQLVPSMPTLVGDVLASELSARYSMPVHLDNDIKLATEGEQWEGDHDHGGSMVYVHWGDRVGAGIVIDGQLHRGSSNDAGDIGFLDLIVPATPDASDRDDRLGLFEAWVGVREFLRVAGRPVERSSAPNLALDVIPALEATIVAARAGDAEVLAAVDELASRLAYGLVAVRALIDPAVIVIGGPMARLGDLLLERLDEQLAHQPLNMPQVALTSLDRDAVMYGAIRHGLSLVHPRDGIPHPTDSSHQTTPPKENDS